MVHHELLSQKIKRSNFEFIPALKVWLQCIFPVVNIFRIPFQDFKEIHQKHLSYIKEISQQKSYIPREGGEFSLIQQTTTGAAKLVAEDFTLFVFRKVT